MIYFWYDFQNLDVIKILDRIVIRWIKHNFRIGISLTFMLFISEVFSQQVLEEYKLENPNLKHDKQFEHFTANNGLPSGNITGIYQDKFGFLWFGTDNGLSRFDGYDFMNFKADPADSLSLSNNFITCITEDHSGNLWVGTQQGLNRYNRKNQNFIQFFQHDFDDNSLTDNHVRAFHADTTGLLWIETINAVLSKFNIRTNTFQHFKHNPYHNITPRHYRHHFIVEHKNHLWIGSRNIGVYVFDKNTETFVKHYLNKFTSEGYPGLDNLSSHNITCLYIDEHENFLFGSSSNELNILDNADKQFYKFKKLSGVTHIIKDQKGMLWISTSADGVYCYNRRKKELYHYTHDPDNPKSLLNNSVTSIFEDKSGNIWLATRDGVSKFSYAKSRFNHYEHLVGKENSLSDNYIVALLEDEHGDIWIGTLRHGLDKYARKENKFTHYKEGNSKKSLLSNRTSALFQDSLNIYIGLMAGKGFNIYNKATQNFEAYTYLPGSTRKDWYKGFLKDNNGNLMIGLWGGFGIVYFDIDAKQFLPKHHFSLLNVFRYQPIYNILRDNKGFIWVGKNPARYMKVNPDDYSYEIYSDSISFYRQQQYYKKRELRHLTNQSKSYLNSKFRLLSTQYATNHNSFMDKNNHIWLLNTNGLMHYDQSTDDFIHYPYYNVLHLGNSYSGNYLWGFSEAGFFKFYPDKGKYTEFNELKNLDAGILNTLFEDDKGLLWIGTNNGLIQYDTKDKTIRHFLHTPNNAAIDNNNVSIIHYDNESLWVGTDEGLNFYDYTLNDFDTSRYIAIKNINQVEKIDPYLWLATDNGLWKYNTTNGKVKVFKHIPGQKNSMVSNQLFTVCKDQNNNLWIGTDDGFGCFNTQTNAFYSYNQPRDNIVSSFLTKCMIEDSKGKYWIGTADRGIYTIDNKTEQFSYFLPDSYDSTALQDANIEVIFEDSQKNIWVGGKYLQLFNRDKQNFRIVLSEKDGLPGRIHGILEDDHQNLWISTEKGLLKYNDKNGKIKVYNQADGLQGDEFTKAHYKLKTGEMMFGGTRGFNLFHPDSIKTSTYNAPVVISSFRIFEELQQIDLNQVSSLILSYNENFFSFEFAALDYTTPEKNNYAYILEGFDKHWHRVGNKRIANYTKVSPGKYTFRVIGTNSDGKWNNTGRSLSVTIRPPFWKAWWFIGTVSLIVLYVFYRILRYRFKKIQSEKKAIDLEQKLLRSQMHPHFIFNSLTAIQSFIYKQDPAEAGRYLSKFAKLMRLILENSRADFIDLETEITTLEHYLELQKLRFSELFNYSLTIDENLDRQINLIPPMLAQPFIENSIEHGMLKKQEIGNIYINFQLQNNHLVYSIEDDGIGIKKSKELKTSQEKEHRSLATKITRERVATFNKLNKAKIFLEIFDLSQEKNGKTGTKVIFRIPVRLK